MASYIWDLDGTLLDSYPVIVRAARQAAGDAGIRDPEEKVLEAVKRGTVFSYMQDVADRSGMTFEILREKYRTCTHAMDGDIILMAGAAEALERLAEGGAAHYVYTHRGTSSEPILARLGILRYFREVVTAAAGFPGKPSGAAVRYLLDKYSLRPEDTWYVGDRAIDVLCAKDAGIRAILLLPEGACVIPTGQEDRIVRSLDEIGRDAADD